MAKICIPKEEAEKLKALIDSGDISVADLKEMSSKDRTKLFTEHIGEDLAKKLNIGFEQRITSQSKNILENYIERELTHVSRKVKANLTERVIKMKNFLAPDEGGAFLDELVAHKVGVYIEPETAERMLQFAEKAQNLQREIKDTDTLIKYGPTGKVKPIAGKNIIELNQIAEQRLAYGRAEFDVKEYMEQIIRQKAKGIPSPDGVIPKGAFYAGKGIKGLGSVSKAVLATLDNSVFGRQGWKLLFMSPESWTKNFVKSWVDIAKTWGDLKGNRTLIDAKGEPTEFFYENVMRETYADIVSRPNALRGAYRAATNEYGLGVSAEELFPKMFDYTKGDFREKIFGNAVTAPVVRLHKGFENAFSAGSLRMRADFADALIAKVEKTQGLSAMDKDIANALGTFVSSVTGRGELGKLGAIGGELGTIFFSPRFFKSQIDTLLQPYQLATHVGAYKNIPKEVRREIGKRYIKHLAGNTALLGLLATAGLTSLDPRSDAFGYLVIGGRKYDLTGGHRGMFVLMSKMITTKRKNFTNGTTYDVGERYGYDKMEEVTNFLEGKTSPLAGTVIRLMTTGTNFDGYQITPTSLQNTKHLIKDLFVPITLGEGLNLYNYQEPSWIQGAIGEFLGVGNRAQVSRPNNGKWGELLNTNTDKYEKAIDEYNAELWKLVRKNQNSVKVKRMTEEEMAEYYDKEIKRIKDDVFSDYEKYLPKESTK